MPFPEISFYNEGISFRVRQIKLVKAWLLLCVEQEKKEIDAISIILCSDEDLLSVNQTYLQHDTYTDIITFDYSAEYRISGDLFISVDRVRENAKRYEVPLTDELHRVIIHGTLHLCGYKDKTPEEKELMRKKENDALALRKAIF